MWRKFKQHKLALAGGSVLLLLYATALFCEFFSPYDIYERYPDYIYCPPQQLRFFDEGRFQLRPFVYGLVGERDPVTFRRSTSRTAATSSRSTSSSPGASTSCGI